MWGNGSYKLRDSEGRVCQVGRSRAINAGLFYYKDPDSARHLSSNKYYSPMGGRKRARAHRLRSQLGGAVTDRLCDEASG